MDKTKIMVIKKNKQKSRALSKDTSLWKLGDKEIKECDSYKYLGVTFKSNGSFAEHIDKIKEKAHKAYYSLIANSREWGGHRVNRVLLNLKSSKDLSLWVLPTGISLELLGIRLNMLGLAECCCSWAEFSN